MFVIGAGVAGLAAIGAAGSLGARSGRSTSVPRWPSRSSRWARRSSRRSGGQQEVSSDGYAQELTEDQAAQTARVYAEESAKADILVTTALVRGQAPTTITAEMVANMKPGSVIVDLAASGGGNCELTVPGEKIVTDNGVTIIGYTDLTSRMPTHTSQLYGTNLVNLLKLLTPGKDGQLVLDLDDVVQRSITVTRDGETLWPPPPVQVSAAPKAVAQRGAGQARAHPGRNWPNRPGRKQQRRYALFGLAAVAVGAADHLLAAQLPRVLHRVRARGVRRVLRDHQRQRVAAHPADGADQRDLRDHPGRRAAAAGQHQHRWWWCSRSSPRPSPRSTSSAGSASPAG